MPPTLELFLLCLPFLERVDLLQCARVDREWQTITLQILENRISLSDGDQMESWLAYVLKTGRSLVAVDEVQLGSTDQLVTAGKSDAVLATLKQVKRLKLTNVRLSTFKEIFSQGFKELKDLTLDRCTVEAVTLAFPPFQLECLGIVVRDNKANLDWASLAHTVPIWLDLDYSVEWTAYDPSFRDSLRVMGINVFRRPLPGIYVRPSSHIWSSLTHLAIRKGMSAECVFMIGRDLHSFESLTSMEVEEEHLGHLFELPGTTIGVRNLWVYASRSTTDEQACIVAWDALDYTGLKVLEQLFICPPRVASPSTTPPLLIYEDHCVAKFALEEVVDYNMLRNKSRKRGIVCWYGDIEVTKVEEGEELSPEPDLEVSDAPADFEYRLPDDIILLVFDELAHLPEREKREVFSRLSVVSQQWLCCARVSFINSTNFQRASQVDAVLRPGFPLYHLTHLAFTFEVSEDGPTVRDTFDNIMHLITAAPSIQSLQLLSGVREPHDLFPILATKPSLHSLTLRCQEIIVNYNQRATTYLEPLPLDEDGATLLEYERGMYRVMKGDISGRWILTLVATLNLRHLELIGLRDTGSLSSARIYLPKLRSLRLVECNLSPDTIRDLLRDPLTPRATAEIHTLFISLPHSTPYAIHLISDSLAEVLSQCPALEYLTFETSISRDEFRNPSFLSKFASDLPVLRQLRLYGPSMFDLPGLESLPKTLQLLELDGIVAHVEPAWISNLLNEGAMPNLLTFRCASFTSGGWKLGDIHEARALVQRTGLVWEIQSSGVWQELLY